MNDDWLVTIRYTEEGVVPSYYLVKAGSDVQAIRKTLDSDEWGPLGTIKSIEPERIVLVNERS